MGVLVTVGAGCIGSHMALTYARAPQFVDRLSVGRPRWYAPVHWLCRRSGFSPAAAELIPTFARWAQAEFQFVGEAPSSNSEHHLSRLDVQVFR
jgi:hypothetical protein